MRRLRRLLAVRVIAALASVGGCAKDPRSAGSETRDDAGSSGKVDAGDHAAEDFRVSPRTRLEPVDIQLAFSDDGQALAYYSDGDGPRVRRYRAGAWEPEANGPAGATFLAAALASDGVAHFVWAEGWLSSRPLQNEDKFDLLTVTLGADDVWSEPTRIGDTGIGWWQEPTAPAPVVAANDSGLSIVAWSRLDQQVGPAVAWASAIAPGAAPIPDRSIDVAGSTRASRPSVAMRGAAGGVVGWSTFDGTTRWMLIANYSEGGWGAPIPVDQAVGGVSFGGQDAFTVTGDLSGETVVAYERSDAQGSQMIARHSADGLSWSEAEATAVASDLRSSQVAGDRGGQVVATWTDGSYRSGLPLTVRFYAPGKGWSAPTVVDGASGATVALGPDGRAALAYQAFADPAVAGLDGLNPMTVRRYAPATGWGTAEVIHEDGGRVTALGFAGNDLIVAWTASNGDSLVKVSK